MKEKKTIGKVIGAVIVLEHLFSSTSFLFLSSRLNDHSAEYVCVCARAYIIDSVCVPVLPNRPKNPTRRRTHLVRGETDGRLLLFGAAASF